MLVQEIKMAFHSLSEQKQNKQNHYIHSPPQQLKKLMTNFRSYCR